MKIGCAVGPFWRFGEKRYKKMKEIGFDYADLGIGDVRPGQTQEEYDARHVYEKELAAEAGVIIHQVHAPFIFPPQDRTPEERAQRIETMLQCMHAAAILGVENFVVHPLMPFYELDDEIYMEETRKTNHEFFETLLPVAKKYGLTICFENTGAYCMTEGISLFLSRDIPAVWLIREDGTRVCVRAPFETATLNTPKP